MYYIAEGKAFAKSLPLVTSATCPTTVSRDKLPSGRVSEPGESYQSRLDGLTYVALGNLILV
jgi:hypothetical protein